MKQKSKPAFSWPLWLLALFTSSIAVPGFATVKNLLDKHKGAFMTGVSVRSIIQKQEAVLLSCLFTIWLRLPLPTNGICCWKICPQTTRYIAWIFLAAVVLINRTWPTQTIFTCSLSMILSSMWFTKNRHHRYRSVFFFCVDGMQYQSGCL